MAPTEAQKRAKRKWYEKNKKVIRAKALAKYYENPQKFIDRTHRFKKEQPEAFRAIRKRYYDRNREWILEKGKKQTESIRKNVSSQLGGKCIVCGESNERYLHFDRIKGGFHHSNVRWVRDHIGEFQILCANHHNEKTVYKEINHNGLCIRF